MALRFGELVALRPYDQTFEQEVSVSVPFDATLGAVFKVAPSGASLGECVYPQAMSLTPPRGGSPQLDGLNRQRRRRRPCNRRPQFRTKQRRTHAPSDRVASDEEH